MAETVDRFLELGELRFHYRETGSSTAAPLVVLHGGSGHSWMWDRFAVALGDRVRVLALDARGHGRSQWAPEYSFELMRDDLRRFADRLGLRRFTLLGHSMGGTVAWLFAMSDPDRLDRLIIVDTPLPRPDPSLAIPTGERRTYEQCEDAIELLVGRYPRGDRSEIERWVRETIARLEDGSWALPHDPAAMGPIVRQLREPDPTWWRGQASITAPTLVIRATESFIPGEETAAAARAVRGARLVDVEGGHSLDIENSDGLSAAVAEFLDIT